MSPRLPGSRRVFLFGHPVSHSLSPAMQNAAFRCRRLPFLYAPLDVPPGTVEAAIGLLRAGNVLGANVTVPHKEAVLEYLDEVDRDSVWLASVNTVYKKGSRLCGTSTDGPGFLRSLGGEARRLRGASVLLVGAGGGARAVAGALQGAGIRRLSITDRDEVRAVRLARLLKARLKRFEACAVSRREAEHMLPGSDLIVQATPLGLHPGDPSPISLAHAMRGALAVDLVYHRRTSFLREASRRGLKTLSGLGMLLHQGALSFERWTGRRAPLVVMEQALRSALSSRR